MHQPDLILAIDNGTLSVRALVFDPAGRLLDKVQIPIEPYFSRKPGWAEQNPEVFWRACCDACRGLWQRGEVDRSRIAGVALTTQRGTVVNVDEKGRPLRPAIVWPDQRKTHGLRPLGGGWGFLFNVLGLSDTIDYLRREAEASWIATYQPEVWRDTYRFLLLSGYLTYQFTGRFVDSVGTQVGYLPFDYKRLRWAGKRDWKWRCLPISRSMLPELVSPGQVLGEITGRAAEATGIPKGLPLIATAADKACEVIGNGSLSPSVGCLSYGTTATININSEKYFEPVSLLPAYPSAIPGYHSVEIQVYRGFWMVNWFKEQFGHPEKEAAANLGLEPEALFEPLVEKIPPGAMGLVLQPYWTPGLKSPGPEAKGAIIGFGDVHTRAHMYRSILEGIAYALREGKEKIERKSKVRITQLRVSGGGSQSNSAMQLTADIFGLPTARPRVFETSGLGAAIDAAVGLGLHPDFPGAIRAMTRLGDMFEPDVANHRRYDTLYRQVYKKMYKRLKPLYEKIREITGYPE